jgi:hypothetical protein
LDDLLDNYEYEKKLAEYANLTKVYNQAILDNTTNSLGETLREYFRNAENLADFEKGSYAERLTTLSQFLSDRNKAILESGGTNFEEPETKTITEDIMGDTLKKKERNRNPLDEPIRKQMGWELQKSTVGEYRQALSGMSRDEIVSYLSNEIGPVYLPYKQNTDAFLASGAEKYHTGGIIDSTHFTNGTDVPALLQKGETVLTKNQINDISKSLVSKDSSGGDNIFNIGSISLPDVKDSSGFIKALENISTKATKATNKRV